MNIYNCLEMQQRLFSKQNIFCQCLIELKWKISFTTSVAFDTSSHNQCVIQTKPFITSMTQHQFMVSSTDQHCRYHSLSQHNNQYTICAVLSLQMASHWLASKTTPPRIPIETVGHWMHCRRTSKTTNSLVFLDAYSARDHFIQN